MEDKKFKALVIEEQDGKFIRNIKTTSIDNLQAGEVVVKVNYSSLNFKDALSSSGNKGVTKNYPHTPGIDAAGVVESSQSDKFKTGDKVVITGYDFGMNTNGGFGQYVRVPAEWPIVLQDGLSLKQSMMLGTAGLTAGMSILKLTQQVQPADGKIVVSGATGGVGSLSIAILAKLGYDVIAISGKKHEEDFLKKLGAKEIISREEFQIKETRPMLKTRFAGAIDTVGGTILDNIIKSTQALGVITCCGNAASPTLDLTVFPFILRGISLIGIDSQNCPKNIRTTIWNKLATEWKLDNLESICVEKGLSEIWESIDQMLAGKLKGRVLVNLDK
jgi:putative YhdH/YhfP family quinone oxidoreductase